MPLYRLPSWPWPWLFPSGSLASRSRLNAPIYAPIDCWILLCDLALIMSDSDLAGAASSLRLAADNPLTIAALNAAFSSGVAVDPSVFGLMKSVDLMPAALSVSIRGYCFKP